MKPGSYRIRLDDVDPVSGEVKSRAEVPYKMPAQIAVMRAGEPPSVIATRPGAAFSSQPGEKQSSSERVSDDGTVLIPEINTAIVVGATISGASAITRTETGCATPSSMAGTRIRSAIQTSSTRDKRLCFLRVTARTPEIGGWRQRAKFSLR